MTVRELLARIDSTELSEWLIVYGLNPWGPERADLRAGTIASTVANCLTDKGHWKPSDFMPRYGPKVFVEPTITGGLKDKMMRFTAMQGGALRK